VRAFTWVIVPAAGEPVVLSDVSIQSTGSRSQDLVIEGDDVSATSFGRTGRRLQYQSWSNERNWFTETAQTERGVGRHAVSFKAHPVPSFGETSVAVIAAARGWERIPVTVEGARGQTPKVTITNTLDHDLGPLLVCERVPRRGVWEFARADGLAKGKTVTLSLSRTGALTPSYLKVESGLELVGWLAAGTTDERQGRYVLYAEDRSPLAIRAPGARVAERTWRVQDVDLPTASGVAGWLGVSVKKTQRGLKIVSVDGRSPAAKQAWALAPGRVITEVAGAPVRTLDDLKRVLVANGPGVVVRVVTADGNRVDLELGDPPPSEPEGD
jgi:hypothetical protein